MLGYLIDFLIFNIRKILKELFLSINMYPKRIDYRTRRNLVIAISMILLILLYMFKNTSFLIRTFSAVFLLIFFFFIDYYFDVRFKPIHYLFIILISAFGLMLSPLYFIYSQYDKILHLVLPIMLSAIVFHMVSKLKLKLKWNLTFVFFIIMGSLALFEIGEYLLDMFFDLKLQGVFLRDIQGLQKFDVLLDKIDDTMIDLVLGFVGALTYAFFKIFTNRLKS